MRNLRFIDKRAGTPKQSRDVSETIGCSAHSQAHWKAVKQAFAEQDIADRAGLGIGAIYRNVPGKDDLLVGVVRSLAGQIAEVAAEAENGAETSPPIHPGVAERREGYTCISVLAHLVSG